VQVDTSGWSGDGTFTATLIDTLKALGSIEFLRVEDAPASRTDADVNFISNEVYVRFRSEPRHERARWLGVVPVTRTVLTKVMTLADLEAQLATIEAVGAPDYADDGMLQFLKAERIIPPYQTRGYKLVELVRVYALA
jgi:hypothetical protein